VDQRQLLTFDFDGVLCRPLLGINPGTGKEKSRETPGRRGLMWSTESFRYKFRRPMPGAMEAFRKLEERFECQVLTARAGAAERETQRWLERYLGHVPVLNMRPHWRETSAAFKARKLSELKPIAHFEDDPFTALWAADVVGRVYLVDWPRNRWVEDSRVVRVAGIDEAAELLLQ